MFAIFLTAKSEHSQVMRFTLNHGSAGVKHQARRRRRKRFWRPRGSHPTPISRHPNSAVRSEGPPGGRAYVYEDEGFTFDAGPTVITAPHTLTDLFELTGRRLEDYIELMEVQPMYRLIWSDGDRFDYVRDEATMVEQIAQRSQKDAEGYQRFFEYAKKVFKKGYTDLADRPFLKFSDMVAVSPSLMRLRADRSVYKTVA